MPDYKKIAWQSTRNTKSKTVNVTQNAPIEEIFNFCQKHIPTKSLLKSSNDIMTGISSLHEAHKAIIEKIAQQPFLAIFIIWTQEVAILYSELTNVAKILLEHKFIGITDKTGKIWTIEDAQEFDHKQIIEAIRCQNEFSIQKREHLVTSYLSFMQWLSQETYGYFKKCEDPDVMRSQGRILAYPLFINFISVLGEKEQLVAKLLYFGGSRTLEEVLNLQLETIDFENKSIQFGTQTVTYPLHVFSDIQLLADKRKRGRLFFGRQNAPLSPPTIFRNFKIAAIEIGLGSTFAPAILTSSN